MISIKETLNKIEDKKALKKDSLLSSAYSLFIRKGINDTRVSDITEAAGVAKGTFYLYFKDKWDIHEKVIIEKAHLLFDEAMIDTKNKNLDNFPDKLINVIDYIINSLKNNKDLIKLINKNLSLGLYGNNVIKSLSNEYGDIRETFETELMKYNKKIKNPSVILFMIIELVSSTCYNAILNETPLPIDEFKPYLFEEIKKMIK